MDTITLRQLRYFEALAQHGHFGRAAEACAISQPALSLQMKALEDTVGAPLVEKSSRQVRLTDLGEAFAVRTRDILRSVDELGEFAQSRVGPFTGRFRLGIIPTIAPYLLPGVIKALSQRFSGLDVLPREAITQKLIANLVDARLDAAIVALPVSEPALHEESLFDEEFLLVRPAADARKPVPDPANLRDMRLLLLEEGHCFRDQALSYCQLTPTAPRSLMEGSSLSTLVQMVAAGIGVTLIPEMAVRLETRSASVAVARLPSPRPARKIGMVWRKTSPIAGHLLQVATLVRKAARDLNRKA